MAELVPLRRNRDFQLLWGGSGLAVLAERFSAMALTLVVLWSTGSTKAAGLVSFAALLPMLLVQLPAGVLVDRWNRRRIMVVCVVGRLAGIASVAVAIAMDRVWVPHLAAVAFVQGTMTVFYQLAERVTVRDVVPGEQLPAAMSQNEARGRAANFVGHPLGTTLYGLVAWAPFGSSVLLYALSLIALLRLRLPAAPDGAGPRPRQPVLAGAAAGLRWVWRQTYFRIALLLVAGGNLVFQGLILTLQVSVKQAGHSPSLVGLIMAASSAGGLAGALAGGWWVRRAAMRHIMVIAHLTWAVIMAGMIFTRHPVALGALFFCASLIGAATTVAGMVYQMRITPRELQGRVGSVVMLLTAGASALGALGTGFLLDAVTVTAAFTVMAAVMAGLAVITLLVFLRRGAARADAEAAGAGMGNV